MPRRSAMLVAVIGCIAAVGVAGCGSSKSSSSPVSAAPSSPGQTTTSLSTATTSHPNVKFLLHFGLAGGAFHHFIYLPFKAGDFTHPLSHKLSMAKAGAAGVFVYHELKLSADDAKSSKTLSTLFGPITALANRVNALRTAILHGKPSAAEVTSVQSGGNSIGQTAGSTGNVVIQAAPDEVARAGGPKP